MGTGNMNFIQQAVVAQLSNLPAIEGLIMTINLDFWSLLSVIGGALGVFFGFQIWCVRTVSQATSKWSEVTGAIKEAQGEVKKLGETIQKIEADRDYHKAELQALRDDYNASIRAVKTEIEYIQSQFMQRIEILETLKRTEMFFSDMVAALRSVLGDKFQVKVPDLQTPILIRQQKIDDDHLAMRAKK
jgi:uncharacterized protein YjbJ (UPF0337 family)